MNLIKYIFGLGSDKPLKKSNNGNVV